MPVANPASAVHIRQRACHPQKLMVRSFGKLQLSVDLFHILLLLLVKSTILPDLRGRYLAVIRKSFLPVALPLNVLCHRHALLNCRRCLLFLLSG